MTAENLVNQVKPATTNLTSEELTQLKAGTLSFANTNSVAATTG